MFSVKRSVFRGYWKMSLAGLLTLRTGKFGKCLSELGWKWANKVTNVVLGVGGRIVWCG